MKSIFHKPALSASVSILVSTIVALTIASSAIAALKEGQTAPEFTTQASFSGKAYSYSLKEQLKKGTVVVYFYPSAYTNGCNIQAHSFAESAEKFKAAGASIVGVSLDSIERLNDFSADPDFCAGKISVASDADGKIAKSYELTIREAQAGRKDSRGKDLDHGFAERTTFIITPDGKINATVGGVSPFENVEKSLAIVQKIAAKKS
ncbi:peroxiredoxin [Undibacterium flavidum]|uniref:thioredoxin-dependent peroxiredoxin n=1 Tax=Undibacterium flavidum TaxID=2762297 RepID=A0ABR6YBN4_9BURK|nr:peroxiredoxin [Undibacterium flavidum]MBC3874006.1 peroxiredoxin [Undibacterium flavidum]